MKFVCQVCGYVHEGDEAPAKCPVCMAPAAKFTKQEAEMTWAAEHVVGVAADAPEDIQLLLDNGVDVIMTNYTDVAIRLRDNAK